VRFARDEARALRPLGGRAPFRTVRELVRRVQADCCVEVDGNAYSVPWRLIGEGVVVEITGGRLRVRHAGREVAAHDERGGRRQRAVDPAHFEGVAGFRPRAIVSVPTDPASESPPVPQLLRPLSEYEAIAGGRW
jgi:hypothetical protein